jgi:hypothetical protein
MMMEETSKDELKLVLYLFKKYKIPRTDGWTVEFFIGFYDLVEEDMLRFIKEVRNSGKVLGEPLTLLFF